MLMMLALLSISSQLDAAVSNPSFVGGGLRIWDYQQQLNRNFRKTRRLSTHFIIIHTSEAGLASTLRTLSKGKRIGKYRTNGGHANYAIARNGKIYRILDPRYRADHTGLSMWNGTEDISSHSLGIELVGFHYGSITKQQYRSLSRLLKVLKRLYQITGRNILTHCQVAYGKPNLWFNKPHRGRKRCAINFDRKKAGLTDAWTYDPDVRLGRLVADRQIHEMFYTQVIGRISKKSHARVGRSVLDKEVSNIISTTNTAWNIAGEDYNDPTTIYIFPDSKTLRGDQIEKRIGWNRILPGTQVLINQPLDREKKKGPIYTITEDYTAWSFAGISYKHSSTFYFLPRGKIIPGNRIQDWDALPSGTRLIVGYEVPKSIESKRGKTAWGIAGKAYNSEETVYWLPKKGLVTGDSISDFLKLPRGSKVFLKINRGGQ